MPVRRNSYYQQDPSIAKGLSNIATMFAPPSGSDVAGFATAQAKQAESARAAALYDYAKSPEYRQELFDRMAVATGNYNPTQSFYAQNQNNATTQRGQDVSAATQQRGHDVTARTSLINNQADNNRAFAQTRYGAISEGQTLPEMPANVAGMFGLPAAPAAVTGIVKTNQGQTANLPDGSVIAGPAKPLTESEVIGAALGRLPDNEQRAVAMKGVNPTAVMKDGKQTYVNAADAAGAEVPVDPTKETLTTAIGPDGGRLGPAVMRNGKLVNPQSGAEYPADVASATLSVQAATPGALGGKTTEDQRKAGYAYDMTDKATTDILNAFDTGNLPTRGDNLIRGVADAAPGALRGPIQNQMTPQGQVFLQNVKTALPMQLLTQSGMGVTEGEYERKMQELVPVSGEDPGVTAAKRRQFATYRDAVKRMAGPAIADPAATTPPQAKAGNVPVAPPPPSSPQGNAPNADPLAQAREAIAKGAPRAAVIERLRKGGIDPTGL